MTLGSEQPFPRVRVGPWSENEPSGAWDCPADVELSTRTSRGLFSPPRQPGLQAGKASGPVGAAGGRWLSVRSPPLLLPWCWGPQVGLPCRGPPQPWPDERQTWPRASLWLHLRGGKEATGRGALSLLPQTHASAPGARTAPDAGPLHRHRVLRPLL